MVTTTTWETAFPPPPEGRGSQVVILDEEDKQGIEEKIRGVVGRSGVSLHHGGDGVCGAAGYVHPEADLLLETARQAGQSAPRDLMIILKDYEQEICFILMLWGSYLILSKCRAILRNNYLFTVDLIEETAGESLVPETVIEKLDTELSAGRSAAPLVQALRCALWRYAGTRNVQNLSDAVESSVEALAIRQDAENSMIRYLIWAIPSIGFIGTVRGIGEALSLAGDIAGMTNSLGVAFNSTLVALLISILLMFLFHQLQRLQDGQLVDIQAYCDRYLLARIK
jgi:biopolymer transport protein ExbB/TolQ